MVNLPQRRWHAAPLILEQHYSDRNDNNYHASANKSEELRQTGFLRRIRSLRKEPRFQGIERELTFPN